MSFDVVMLATPEIDYYAEGTRANWQSYCDRQGYTFVCGRERIFEDMHVVWSKVGLIEQQMSVSDSEWIVLVDADTVVNRPDYKLEELIAKYPGRDVLISEDCSRRFGVPVPLSLLGPKSMGVYRAANTGFLAIRNNAFGRRFIDHWMELAKGEFVEIADEFPS